MERRGLGTQGLEVSALGLGCMGMSYAYGDADAAECEATLLEAIDRGVTLLDTAEVYGPYENERQLGRWLAGGRREQVVIATKFGFEIDAEGRIDLLYQHRVDPAVPIEDVVGAMADLVREGKVRYLGLSEASAATLRRAHAVHPISALQSEYSLWERGVERSVLPTCRELGIGLVPYSPLGRGFLAGLTKRADEFPPGDFRRGQPRITGENFDANLRLLAGLEDVAVRVGATPAQAALAWLLWQGPDIVPIPGTTRRTRLRENLGALDVQLPPGELFQLEQLFAPGSVAGERYSPAGLATLDRGPG
jgi:aryl-alcohol dehydrogenase-like predicted oxidoreductase